MENNWDIIAPYCQQLVDNFQEMPIFWSASDDIHHQIDRIKQITTPSWLQADPFISIATHLAVVLQYPVPEDSKISQYASEIRESLMSLLHLANYIGDARLNEQLLVALKGFLVISG